MGRRTLGLVTVVTGAVIALAGLLGVLDSDGGEPEAVGSTTTSSAPSTTSTTVVAPTTSTAPTVTTSTTPTTTSTIDAEAEVVEFVGLFTAAIERGDGDFLFDALHPGVLSIFDAELCRSFIDDEILLLVNYRLTGDVTGPVTQTFAGSSVETYQAPVSFDFQGQSFDSVATFALDDDVRWFTECR